MKKLLSLLLLLLPLSAVAPASSAEPPAISFLPGSTPVPEQARDARLFAEGDELVKKHCTGCHSEGRIMASLQSMHSAQNDSYEQQVKNIVVRKIRLTNGSITRQEGRKILDYLVIVWNRQKAGATLSRKPDRATTSHRQAAARLPGRPS